MSVYSDAILALSPVAYWRLGEASGTSAADATGHGYTGTYHGSPTLGATGLLTGDSDKAVTLNGSSQYIDGGTVADVGTAGTVLAWIKTTATSQGRFLSKRSSTPYWDFYMASGSQLGVDWNDGTTDLNLEPSCTAFNDGLPHLVAFTFGAGAVALYLDAATVFSGTHAFGTLASGNHVYIGNLQLVDRFFNGTIDDAAIFASALSSAQIANLYQLGLGHFISPALTGAGVATITKSTARSKASTLTGAGVATVVGRKGASFAPTLTGAGVATLVGKKAASAALTLTGAGTATLARTSARSAAASLTGAGTASLAGAKGAKSAQTLTGAGVVTVAESTARAGAVTMTGAGTATITATAIESGNTVTATGAGVATITVRTARSTSITTTGAGVATVSETSTGTATPPVGAAVVTGPAGWRQNKRPLKRPVLLERHEVALHLTGGGRVTVFAQVGGGYDDETVLEWLLLEAA